MQNQGSTVQLPRLRIALDSVFRRNWFASLTPQLRTSLIALLVAIGYFGGSQVGFLFTPSNTPISTFWPPNAILLAAFLLAPVRIWWVLVLAVLPVHFLIQLRAGIPAVSAFGWFLGNVGEALLGAACVRSFQNERKPLFGSVRGVVTFLFLGVFLAPLLTSFLDAGFTVATGLGRDFWILWLDRLTSNMIANLTVVPTIVALVAGGISKVWKASRAQLFEAALLFAFTAVITFLVFGRGILTDYGSVFVCAPLPFLVWAALRFGPAGLGCAMLEVTIISIWTALHTFGIFTSSHILLSAISVRILLGLFMLPLILMAAVFAERRDEAEALKNTQDVLISEQEAEYQRIARKLHTEIAGQLTLASIEANEVRAESQPFEKVPLDRLYNQIFEALETTLHLSGKIYPFRVEYLGLARGLTNLCLEISAETGVAIKALVEDIPSNVPLSVSLRIFRVAQLALEDIMERQAKIATVELKEDNGQILLRLTDDGKCKDPGRAAGIGLAHMRALLLSLGGTFTILPGPGGSTVTEASVPTAYAG